MPSGLASGVVDDEGSATRDRTLIQAGTLKGFISDMYHSSLVGMPPGNGFRRAVATVEGAYTRPAEPYLSNLVVEPGSKALDDLIADVDRGVYVEKFAAPEVNPFSGSFAMEVRNATLIEQGGLTDHVKVALLTGNFFEGLKNVVGIGKDPMASHAFLTMPGCSYVPPMAFDGFELVGQT
jgi:predicted Zn-dependent protease